MHSRFNDFDDWVIGMFEKDSIRPCIAMTDCGTVHIFPWRWIKSIDFVQPAFTWFVCWVHCRTISGAVPSYVELPCCEFIENKYCIVEIEKWLRIESTESAQKILFIAKIHYNFALLIFHLIEILHIVIVLYLIPVSYLSYSLYLPFGMLEPIRSHRAE